MTTHRLPWRQGSKVKIHIYDADDQHVTTCHDEETAARILRAVNWTPAMAIGVELAALPEAQRYSRLAELCRMLPGPCICGCHTSPVETADGGAHNPTPAPVGEAVTDPEIARVRNALRTQDKACTAHAIFVVERKVRDYGFDEDYAQRFAWVNSGAEECVCDKDQPERFAELERGEDSEDETGKRNDEDWVCTGYRERWEFVQPFLTREAAENYGRSQAYNLGEWRVFVESGHRNYEWQWLRKYFGGEDV